MKSVFVISLAISFVTVQQANAYASGAPGTESVCASLSPSHGPIEPQKIPLPFNLTLNKVDIKSGDSLQLTISSETETIKGFLVQGRAIDYNKTNNTSSKGMFALDNPYEMQIIQCGKQPNSAITHNGSSVRSSVTVTWFAPMEKGDYVLLATVVKDGYTFWVRQPTAKITVG